MRILGIDPGTTESGWVVYEGDRHAISDKGVTNNHDLLARLEQSDFTGETRPVLAIEMIASMGMAVGSEVFETCVWVGMFMHAWGYEDVLRLTRNQVKVFLCGSSSAKDPNVRQAIIDLFPVSRDNPHVWRHAGKVPTIGTKKCPGPLFGMNSHMWPALGVALTANEKLKHAPARLADRRPTPRKRARL